MLKQAPLLVRLADDGCVHKFFECHGFTILEREHMGEVAFKLAPVLLHLPDVVPKNDYLVALSDEFALIESHRVLVFTQLFEEVRGAGSTVVSPGERNVFDLRKLPLDIFGKRIK